MKNESEEPTRFVVVMNDEEQYSIWPESRELPPGWREAGARGERGHCLDYIEKVWTDMRPLSLRRRSLASEREKRGAGQIAGDGAGERPGD